jgi:hypothetical protein
MDISRRDARGAAVKHLVDAGRQQQQSRQHADQRIAERRGAPVKARQRRKDQPALVDLAGLVGQHCLPLASDKAARRQNSLPSNRSSA